MTLTLRQSRRLLRRVRFDFDPERYRDFSGDGEIVFDGNEVSWSPPGAGWRSDLVRGCESPAKERRL